MQELDKPYKSIHLTCTEMFAVDFALRDREKKLVADVESFATYQANPEVVEEANSQLAAVRAVRAVIAAGKNA